MYRFQFEYTLEDYEALSRLGAKTTLKKPIGIRRGLCALFAVICLVSSVYWVWLNSWLSVVPATVGIFLALETIFWHPLTARRIREASLKGMGTVTVELEEEGVRNHHQKGESFRPYEVIEGAFHYRQRYFLALDDRQVLLMPERALVEGDATLLKAFLEEKLGKEIKEIH